MIIMHYKDLKDKLVFIENFYDYPLTGLCTYNGNLASFRRIPSDADIYEITELSLLEKISSKINQWTFEICVGTHWSYKNGKSQGEFKGFSALTRLYYWVKGY